HAGLPEVPFSNVIAVRQGVVACRLSGERHTLRLSFDGDKSCSWHSPRGNHRHCSDTATEVQRCLRRGTPSRAIPRGEDVVRGKAVPVPQLEQAEVAADRVESLARFGNAAESRRNRPWLSPTLEMRF